MQGSLEVYWSAVALSMQTAYSVLLRDSVPVHHYHVFAHLCRFGYIVRRRSTRYLSKSINPVLFQSTWLEFKREYYLNCFKYCQRATSSMGTVNKNSSHSLVWP